MSDDSGLLAATLSALAKDFADFKADQRTLGERVGKVEDVLIRLDERQKMWATRQELSETESRLRSEIQPVDASARAVHRRMDEFTATLDRAVAAVREDLKERDETVDKAEKRIKTVEDLVTTLRLSWAKASGIGLGAGILGGGSGALLTRLTGG